MVIEEVRYDFEKFPRYADDFIRDLIRLMIISKLNAAVRNPTSRSNFLRLVSQIEGCEAYVVKYGQPLLYAKYRDLEFTDQKVTSQFVRTKEHVIDVTTESVFGDFVKRFDNLASMSDSKVQWGVLPKSSETLEKVERKDNEIPDPLFMLLNSFTDSVSKLTSLDSTNPDSLAGKRFGIRNASIARKALHLEFLLDGQLNILELNPSRKRKDDAIKLLFAKSRVAEAIVSLMKEC